MRSNPGRILVSHAGNLPRPTSLDELIDGGRATKGANTEEYHKRLPDAVKWIVDRQIELGVDQLNDGEYAKAGSYGGYMQERVTGYSTVPVDPNRPPKRAGTAERDRRDFPGFFASGLWFQGSGGPIRPGFMTPGEIRNTNLREQRACTGPVTYIGQAGVQADIANLKAAIAGKDVEGYVAALGPLSLGAGVRNDYYKTEDEYLMAVADACREEYKAITDAGLIVQLDEPEFCTSWYFYPDWSVEQYRAFLDKMVEVLNHSIRGLPVELVRFHTCWGSGHRPHVNDIELKYIADIMLKINAQQYSIEAANVRHEHEYHVWEDVKLPAGKMLMPGVIAHATDLVEHPEVVAERLVNYAKLVGRENVQTGTDCGIGSRVGHEEVVWAKLKTMSEGARIASKKLWS
ncbi:MAG TPA: cobalamin-independent methionine synthase II family protein [Dehalococcoidia bacterium]|nr:cobalamin-independent methionine synthase II family protein [Dehalococcoidia bacterium]